MRPIPPGNANNIATLVNGPAWLASTVPFAPPTNCAPNEPANTNVLQCNAQIGRTYAIQSANVLDTNAWSALTNMAADSTNVVYSESISNSQQRFYRVKLGN